MTPDDHYNAINKYTMVKSLADLSGNKGAAAAADANIQMHKTELDRSKRIKEDNKDQVTAADGINVPEDISKDVAKNVTAGHKTIYQTGPLEKPMDPDAASEEQRIASDVHAPLAASYMRANPNTQEVSSVIKAKTLKASQDIATIQSDAAPIDAKQKAVTDFQSYMQENYQHVTDKQIAADSNLHHVVTKDLMAKMDAIMKTPTPVAAAPAPAAPTQTQPAAPAQPTNVVGTWNPATGKIE